MLSAGGSTVRRNGLTTTGPLPTVDPNVDIAAEMGIDEARLRRAIERNWIAPGRAAGELEELEALLRPDHAETVTPTQALAELPRLLEAGTRRPTGAFRPLAELLSPHPPPPPSRQPTASDLGPRVLALDGIRLPASAVPGSCGCGPGALRCWGRRGGR